MITIKEVVEYQHINNDAKICFHCKQKVGKTNEYYSLSKRVNNLGYEQDVVVRESGNGKKSALQVVYFCDECWMEIAGEQYQFEHASMLKEESPLEDQFVKSPYQVTNLGPGWKHAILKPQASQITVTIPYKVYDNQGVTEIVPEAFNFTKIKGATKWERFKQRTFDLLKRAKRKE